MKRVSLIASMFGLALFLAACEDPGMEDPGGEPAPEQQQDFGE